MVGGKSSISHITRYVGVSAKRLRVDESRLSFPRSVGFLSPHSAPKEERDGNEGTTRRYLLADDRHCSPPRDCAFICCTYTHETRLSGGACSIYPCACHSSSRTIPHPRDYSRWQRLIIPRKVHPPIMVSRRAAAPRHCYGFFVVTLLLRTTRAVS